MIKHQKRTKSEKQPGVKNEVSNKLSALLSGTVVALFLIISPYLFSTFSFFPETKELETIFGNIESGNFLDVSTMVWVVLGKLIPLLMLLIWFFTCKHWWYHAILVPILMYFIQIILIFTVDVNRIDDWDFFFLAPFVLAMAVFIYTLRLKVFDKIYGIDYEELKRLTLTGKFDKEESNSTTYQHKTVSNAQSYDDDDEEPPFMAFENEQ